MNRLTLAALLLFVLCAGGTAFGQASLDGTPYTPGVDAEIDMYINSWKHSMPRSSHGSLVERDIFTRGDPDDPPRKGAVLSFVNRFCHATLAEGAQTSPTVLEGEQELFYIIEGSGTISTETSAADLSPGVSVLMPPGVGFTMRNTGGGVLAMYLVAEPVPDGFRTNADMLVVDEKTVPITSSDAHWVGIVKSLFTTADGLGTLESVLVCYFDPMTFFHPHSHIPGCEEVWAAVDKPIHLFFGKQLRVQQPGEAYLIPPDGKTPHANFNVSDTSVKLFYFARYRDHELRE